MKRALSRCLYRYLHVLVTGLIITLVLYVYIMQRVALTSSSSSSASLSSSSLSFAASHFGTFTDVQGLTPKQSETLKKAVTQNVTVSPSHLEAGGEGSVLLAGVPRSHKGYLTLGIPTLKRPKGDYFFSTLASLLQQSTPAQQLNMTLVILLADRDPDTNLLTLASIKARYRKELSEGLMLVVSAPDTEHIFRAPNLKRTFNDSLERVRWRSKQNLDYAALMEFSTNLSTYYLQIEDDVTAAPNYVQHIQVFVQSNQRRHWAGLEVCPHGFIGKLFRSSDLPKLVAVLRTFYLEQPCDFLIHHFYHLMLQTKVIRRGGNLFFHQGKFSSLANVTRKTDHRTSMLRAWAPVVKKHRGHSNPEADLYSNVAVYRNYVIRAAYDLATEAFFWGKDVKEGDDVTVVFRSPQPVARILVDTGISDKMGRRRDFVRNGTVEVGEKAYVGLQGRKALCTDTRVVGSFVNGRFDQSLMPMDTAHASSSSSLSLSSSVSSPLVRCFTIVITQAQKEWVAIPEIVVFLRGS
ncbi:alpha-1,6-mannosyl-glycoprotein 4-beta-N-acetylglucosaminyltransferase-like [Babylonia areolata]|uniref:alpha-1,6-mannosyl-glycoprotein 4-beta-N-acetylglucosaminyltransferase-like n=1 Tax=Babylonia areolata TaxID=304850 RepID=UPI003FD35764